MEHEHCLSLLLGHFLWFFVASWSLIPSCSALVIGILCPYLDNLERAKWSSLPSIKIQYLWVLWIVQVQLGMVVEEHLGWPPTCLFQTSFIVLFQLVFVVVISSAKSTAGWEVLHELHGYSAIRIWLMFMLHMINIYVLDLIGILWSKKLGPVFLCFSFTKQNSRNGDANRRKFPDCSQRF